jgi:RNA polymerase sigma-32 factor
MTPSVQFFASHCVEFNMNTALALSAGSNGAVVSAAAPSSAWGLLPPLGHLDAYISAVNRMPLLTLEQEQADARALRATDDVHAAGRLVMSHLRLVVSVSRQYLGYGLPHADLIQEGNVGLMKAVRRFDPDQGVRLVSYALHWIKAEIHEYILRNWRMVKVATTKSQRKLFFNLRSLKASLKQQADDLSLEASRDRSSETLTAREVDFVARELNVDRSDVIEMETRLMGGDVALDPGNADDGEEAFGPIAYLKDERHEPTAMIAAAQRDRMASDGVTQALAALDDRSRRIVEQRWLAVNDDGSGGMTLHELADEYGVSAERIRQIEVAAMKKMKASLQNHA